MPRARDYTAKYFTLSYYNPSTGKYGLGWADAHLVLFCVVLLTGLRAATMEYILAPFAKSQGMSKRKDITRFSEQAWMVVYYSAFWPLGLVRLRRPRSFVEKPANSALSTSTASRRPTSTSASCGRVGQIARSAGL
jgi:acyl-CoA-dependent ceramide synthase